MRVLNADASAHKNKLRGKKKNSVFVFCCSLGDGAGLGCVRFMLVYREAPPTGWKARCHCRPALPGPVACAFQGVGGGRQYSALFRTTGMSKYNVYRIDRTAGWFFFCQKIINARGCLYSCCVYLNDDMMRRRPGARSSECHSPRNLCCEPQPHDARACVIHA